MSKQNFLWGIDLGGTKTECAVLSATNPLHVIARHRIPTEADRGYHHIIRQIKTLVEKLSNELGESPDKIGFGTPGALEPSTQLMKNCNTTCLNGIPLKKDLEEALKVPVKITNDANCFALAETLLGSVPQVIPNAEVVFGIIMGTGVGGGIVVNGKSVNGRQGIAGEWGHNYLDESGGKCYCGKIGCVETIISGPALQRYYQSLTGNPLSLEEITKRYNAGTDKAADQTIQRLITFFGKSLAAVINIIDPDVIVIGGGVGNIDALYTLGVEETKKHVFNIKPDLLIVKPVLGDSAGVFGAAML
jgi:predicted NBD/HSP70 family sugar kinase